MVKSYGTSTRTDAERARSTYSHRKRFQPPCTFNSTSAAVSAVTGPLPTVTTPRLRAAFHNTYGSVLPLLHKRSGGTAYGSPMFTGYVPKAKQATTTADRCRVPSSSELPTNVIAASEPTQDENRRPKVCFALPAKANSSCNGRGGAATTDISTGITSYHPKSGVVSSSTADRSQPTDVVANTTVSQSVVVCQNAFQSSPDILPLSVVASGANGSLTGVTAARENHVSFVTVPNSTNGENLSSDENARRVADPLTDVVDDWLCNEIYTSDIFKNNGLCPENMLGELLSSVGNGCQPDDSTGASPSCDILNGDSSNYTNDDLSIIDPVTQFTFDDMLSYLYN